MTEPVVARERLEAGFWVGEFFAEPDRQRLSGADGDVRVEPKVMEVLVCLAASQGRTVTKRQFMERVWEGTVVTEDALLRCISELRKVFGDDPREPRFIETIRKRGYRLVAPVTPVDARAAPPSDGLPQGPADPERVVQVRVEGAAAAGRRPVLHGASRWLSLGAGLLLLGGLAYSVRQLLLAPAVPLRAVPLTTYPGEESDPNLSPDGDRVAFVWNAGDGGSFDIYIKQLGVETPVRLTQRRGDDASPAWSPDGQYIAFVRSEAGSNGLYMIPSVGGPVRQVLDLGARRIHAVAWSPDGRRLAFSAERAPHASFQILLLTLETRDVTPLTDPPEDYQGDLQLAFSPDGSRLAFTRSAVDRVDDVYVVSVRDGAVRRITTDHAEVTGLDWSADGHAIVFASDREGISALWRVPASGGQPRWISTFGEGGSVLQPSTARRGRRMAFVQRQRETNIWQVGLTPGAGGPKPLISSTRWDSNPDVSPDGQRVAFVSNRSGSYEIWISERDGSDPVQLTRFGGPFASTPRWAPDGWRIAFAARNEAGVDIYTVNTAGGAPVRLTTHTSNDRAPSWSRDGRWVYFTSNRDGRWQIWKVEAGGGEPVRVTRDGGYMAFESPDGRDLYFVKRETPGIWRMPVGGGDEVLVVPGLQPSDWGNWAVGADGLYFVERAAGRVTLLVRPYGAGRARPLRTLERLPPHPALALTPDGRFVLHTRIDRSEADILLVDDFE